MDSALRTCIRQPSWDNAEEVWLNAFVYRELNKKTLHDRYSLARVQKIIARLAGIKWFAPLDLGKAYH